MFAVVCRMQWKASRTAVVLLAVVGFLIPLVAVQQAGFSAGDRRAWDVALMLATVESAGALFPTLALILGLALAVAAWSADHQTEHVYALTLPVPRWYYVLLRFGAGALLLVPVAVAVALGCTAAVATLDLPDGLRTYPGVITLRFAIAALLCYALLFAMAAATKRTVAITVGAVAVLLALLLLLDVLGVGSAALVEPVLVLFSRGGPLGALAGPWMLIGV